MKKLLLFALLMSVSVSLEAQKPPAPRYSAGGP